MVLLVDILNEPQERQQFPILSAIPQFQNILPHLLIPGLHTFCIHFSCPRIITSQSYPHQWETNPCTTVDVGYRIMNYCHSGKESRHLQQK